MASQRLQAPKTKSAVGLEGGTVQRTRDKIRVLRRRGEFVSVWEGRWQAAGGRHDTGTVWGSRNAEMFGDEMHI